MIGDPVHVQIPPSPWIPALSARLFLSFEGSQKLHCNSTAKNINIRSGANLSPKIGIQGDGKLCTRDVILMYVCFNFWMWPPSLFRISWTACVRKLSTWTLRFSSTTAATTTPSSAPRWSSTRTRLSGKYKDIFHTILQSRSTYKVPRRVNY